MKRQTEKTLDSRKGGLERPPAFGGRGAPEWALDVRKVKRFVAISACFAVSAIAGYLVANLPARAALAMIIIPLGMVVIFYYPYLGLLGQVAFFFQPVPIWGGPAYLRPVFLITAGTFVFYVLNTLVLTKRRPVFLKTHWFMLGMVLCLYLSSAFAQVSKEMAYQRSLVFLKLFVFVFLMTNLLTTPRRLKLFLGTVGGFCALMALRSILVYVRYGVARVDTVGGLQGGANELAAMLIGVMPLFWYFASSPLRRERLLARLAVPLFPAGVVTTGSRAGAIGLGVSLFGIFLNSRKKGIMALAMVAMLGGMVVLAPESYKERIATIDEYKSDASAMSRITLWKAGLQMWTEHPLTGVGPDNFSLLSRGYTGLATKSGEGFVAHSTYVSLLAEAGVQTLLLFLALAGWTLLKLRTLRKRRALSARAELDSLFRMASGVEIGIWALLVIGVFGTFESSDFLYWFFGASSCVFAMERSFREKEADRKGASAA